jgi:hypothetical protein
MGDTAIPDTEHLRFIMQNRNSLITPFKNKIPKRKPPSSTVYIYDLDRFSIMLYLQR